MLCILWQRYDLNVHVSTTICLIKMQGQRYHINLAGSSEYFDIRIGLAPISRLHMHYVHYAHAHVLGRTVVTLATLLHYVRTACIFGKTHHTWNPLKPPTTCTVEQCSNTNKCQILSNQIKVKSKMFSTLS